MSRDDYGSFIRSLPSEERPGAASDPFQTIDFDGVGGLMKIGVEKGRATRHDLKIGICGEHGGEPDSRQVLPQDRAELRQLQSLPRADRPPGGGTGGAGGTG